MDGGSMGLDSVYYLFESSQFVGKIEFGGVVGGDIFLDPGQSGGILIHAGGEDELEMFGDAAL